MKGLAPWFGGLMLLWSAGCSSPPSHQPWNRPSKSEIAQPWLRVGNPETEEHRAGNPYP